MQPMIARSPSCFFVWFSLLGLSSALAADPFEDVIRKTEPLTPERERKAFHLPPGFEIQLVASEPQIGKPMNMAFDAHGRLHDDVKRANCLIQMAGSNINTATGLDEAEAWLAEAHQLAERTGNHHELLHAELFRARLDQLRAGDASSGPQFVRLLDWFRRIGDRRCVARCLLGLGRAAVADGDLEPARRHLAECALIADAVGDPLALAAAQRLVARCDHSAGLSRHAATVLGAADAAAERVDMARRRALPEDDDLRVALEHELQGHELTSALADGRELPIEQLLAL